MEGWHLCRSVKGTYSGRSESRTHKAHRSAVFETAAITSWLALPLPAAVTGIEPVSVRLTGACPYQHGPHRNRVGAVGFEPTISCFRSRRNCQAFPYADCKSAQRESNPHIRHGKAVGCRYIVGACFVVVSIFKEQSIMRAPGRTRTGVAALRVRSPRRWTTSACLSHLRSLGAEGVEPSSGPYKRPALTVKLRANEADEAGGI